MRVRSSTINVNWGSNDVFYFPSPREIWESIYGQLFRCSTLNWKLSLLLLLLGSALSPSSFPFMKMTINVWKSTLVILLMWRQNLEHWMLNTNGLEWINQFNFQLKWKFKMLLAHLITVHFIKLSHSIHMLSIQIDTLSHSIHILSIQIDTMSHSIHINYQIDTFKALNHLFSIKLSFFASHIKQDFRTFYRCCPVIRYSRK